MEGGIGRRFKIRTADHGKELVGERKDGRIGGG